MYCLLPKLATTSQSLVKCFGSNSLQRPLKDITAQKTIFGGVGTRLGSCTLTAKTRDNMSSIPNIAHIPKKHLQGPFFPAMKGFFRKEPEISTRHASSAVGITIRSSAATSNDLLESESIQVFISFRGETRTGFTGHLYKGLTQAGYRAFIDDIMRRGENIEEELIKAIRNSEASVVVISQGYASSQSCLDELVEILRCKRRFGHKVLPVFYLVDPDDVYNQTSNFGAAFHHLVNHFEDATNNKRVNRWKEALKEVVGISGLVLHQHEYEAYFIDQIVVEIKVLLSRAPMGGNKNKR